MEQTSIQLDLAPQEASILDEGIAALLREVRLELARTDDRHYRAGVHSRLEVLEGIQGKLSALLRAH